MKMVIGLEVLLQQKILRQMSQGFKVSLATRNITQGDKDLKLAQKIFFGKEHKIQKF
jgi:hypothetical protein